jgi:hypothetical protein
MTLRDPYRAGRRVAEELLLPLNLARPRRFDLCCCGLSKTGTHSMAGLFENYRSAHHPDSRVRIRLAMAHLSRELEKTTAVRILRRRDRLLRLEMESSSLAGILIEPLAEACPNKKFILTIRDVYSWCDSWLDHNIDEPPNDSSPWAALDRVRLRVDVVRPTRFDLPLTQRGLPPLECYFRLWADHNSHVLDCVSARRLLVIETHQISAKTPEIAAWAQIPVESMRTDRGWLFVAPKQHRVLAQLDPSYVQDTAHRFCSGLMGDYFPQVRWLP